MTEQELTVKATGIIKQMIDTIADKKYEKLASFMRLDPSWIEEGQTLTEAFVGFGEWIDGQLAMWEEDEGRKFQIDHFDKTCIEGIDLLENQTSAMATYQPTNAGERLDFWFEITFTVGDSEAMIAELNINI